jgi:PAS domain S-box-containing protein
MIGKKREIQARRKDGTEFVAELGLAEIPQKDVEEHLFCGFIRNLTQEKAAQAEILAKQNLTNKIIDASFDALFVINERGIIQMVNQKSCDVFGWVREEFIGKNICMIMGEEHSSNHNEYLSRYLHSGVKNMMGKEREVEARCKDGSKFPCLLGLNEVGVGDGSERVFCGFIRSLTKEKAARAEILAKQNLTRKIIDASYDALFLINEHGIIQMVNEQS